MTSPQSGELDGGEQPQGLPGLISDRQWLKFTILVGPLSVELLLVTNIGSDLRFLKTHGGDRVASGPELFPIEVLLPATELTSHRDSGLSLDRADHFGHRLLRRHTDQHRHMILDHVPFHNCTSSLTGQLMKHGS